MKTTKLNAPIRLPDGEVTTIAALDDAGRIEWRESRTWQGAACYIAELRGSRGEGNTYTGWTVGKVAYASRTGGNVKAAFA